VKHVNYSPAMAILWSIAFPGFGQIYNHHFFKAALFMLMEFIINLNGHLNQSIIHSFFWEISLSQSVLNYNWIMFYPCIYVIPMWDAYAEAYKHSYSIPPPSVKAIPFVIGAMFATVGVIYGSRLVPGPIFLPIILIIVGSLLGNGIVRIIQQKRNHKIKDVGE
jgi:TM2 domain-containing membrane protein YozV